MAAFPPSNLVSHSLELCIAVRTSSWCQYSGQLLYLENPQPQLTSVVKSSANSADRCRTIMFAGIMLVEGAVNDQLFVGVNYMERSLSGVPQLGWVVAEEFSVLTFA